MILARRFSLGLATFPLLGLIGCTGAQSRLDQPGFDGNAAETAITTYDTDGDGTIGGAELAKVPALQTTLKRVDKNGDSKVTADEIEARIAAWRKSQVALTRLTASVRQGGRPLSGATVTIVPEVFLGTEVKSAQGITDSTGMTQLKISDHPDEKGVHLGYYRVEVSKMGPDGKEMIPARYNSETELGIEMTVDDASSDRLIIDIK